MAEDLAVVEAALQDTSFGGDEMFAEVSRHMMEAGGKRFRAMLVLLAARFGDFRDKRIVPAAVAIELTHLATLFHDDVMDEASIRRGHESANSRFGNSVAILAGDYLFARASRILADLGPDAIRIQAETFGRLVDGQLLETVGVRPGEDPLDHYMHVITEKTGSLIATSGRFGAMFAGLPGETADLISERVPADRGGLAAVRRRARHRRPPPRSRARSRAPTCARASGRCRCSTRCAAPRPTRTRSGCASCCATPTSPTRSCTPRRCGLLRESPALEEARADGPQLDRRGAGPARAAARRPGPGRLRVPLRLRQHPHRLARCT